MGKTMRWSWNVQGSPLRSVQGVAAASTSFNDDANPWKDYDCSVAWQNAQMDYEAIKKVPVVIDYIKITTW